jgi:hypothetical protein
VPDEHGIVDYQSDERSLTFCGQDIPRATLTNGDCDNKGKGQQPRYLCHTGTGFWDRFPIFSPAEPESGFVRQFRVFDVHVLEFAGFEDLAAFLAFDEFGVFFTRHDLNARVLAR